jgi:hypothetical protein
MQKWGKDARGNPRFRCENCGTSTLRKRFDLSQKYKRKLFQKWLLGKLSLEEIAIENVVSTKTLSRWFAPFWSQESTPKETNISNQVLIIDGKYLERNATVLIATTTSEVVSWHFTQRENASSWFTFLSSLSQIPFAIVCDGQRGMLKAIKQRFPGIIVQRCQFHVMQYCLTKLTKHPETKPALEFRELIFRISSVKTKEQFAWWIANYKHWFQTHQDFLKEKTYQVDQLTPTGKKSWSYTHGRLHSANSHLQNALPNLFRYLLYKQIHNTSNFIEGAINASIQEKLRFHRGLNITKRRVLIANLLASKQCVKTKEKPTQNVY